MGFFQSFSFYFASIFKLWVGYAISIFLMYVYNRQRMSGKKLRGCKKIIWRFLIILPVVVTASIRGINVGADTINMWEAYLSFENQSLSSALDEDLSAPLFQIFRWLVCKLSNANVQVYFFLIAAITMYFVVLSIEKWNMKNSASAMFVFFCCYGPNLMNQSRQMIAIAIMMYAYWFAYNRKPKNYIVLSVIASLVHMSAVPVAVVMYIVQFKRKSTVRQMCYFGAVILSAIFIEPVMLFVGKMFINTKYYEKYFVSYQQVDIGLGLLLSMLTTVIPALIYRRKMDDECKMSNTLLLVFPTRLVGYFSYFVYRVSFYFGSLNTIALPLAVENSKSYSKVSARVILYGVCILYFLLFYCWSDAYTYFPYYTYYA